MVWPAAAMGAVRGAGGPATPRSATVVKPALRLPLVPATTPLTPTLVPALPLAATVPALLALSTRRLARRRRLRRRRCCGPGDIRRLGVARGGARKRGCGGWPGEQRRLPVLHAASRDIGRALTRVGVEPRSVGKLASPPPAAHAVQEGAESPMPQCLDVATLHTPSCEESYSTFIVGVTTLVCVLRAQCSLVCLRPCSRTVLLFQRRCHAAQAA